MEKKTEVKKISGKDVRLLKTQKYHMTGELHFLRSEDDLHEVTANVLQSIKVIMDYMAKWKTKYASSKKAGQHSFVRVEAVLSKLLHEILAMDVALVPKADAATDSGICIPATCISMECISKILTVMVISLLQFYAECKNEYYIHIIAQVSADSIRSPLA